MDVIGWEKIIALPAALIVLIAILGFFLRALPYWKEVKLAEIKVRESEAAARSLESSVFGKFSDAINSMSGILKDIVIDQKRDNENTRLLQRATADASDKILAKMDAIDEISERSCRNSDRIAALEDKCEIFEGKLTKTKE